ncbi:ABC-type multidrug transport system fused ATPase/permease subunit [Friedmanniella endophytica]|uniref:ABC-type multidrug transport system fused ATPase/permease subunit n=1 Tax=Microlunatus kandeliicorticis TaxID=1759536 RepID=A0A7W3P5D7_9ACTN|nr:ABC transporter ATP-binding protein [Microlunatus kandeliicorticis]MBA8793861.1 ABC-type multidrug transport system fused ATPase/permease subunit [Microlunatus kandeliicorticis]
MQDFPPTVADFRAAPTASDAVGALDPARSRSGRGPEERRGRAARRPSDGQPDLTSPTRFLLWLLGQQRGVLITGSVLAVIWFLPGTVGPFLVGRAVDAGITGGDTGALIMWSGLLLVVMVIAAVFGIVGHTVIVRGWLIAMFRTIKLVNRKGNQLGHILPQRTPTGEVLSVASGDSDQFGAMTEITSRVFGSTVAFLVIAGIVLSTSVPLGLIVLLGAPILVLASVPLLRPMHRSQAIERDRNSTLTSQATDIVAGLRILRGVGGEATFGRNYADQSQKVRQAGVRAGLWQSVSDAASVLFSGLFLVGLTWAGAHEVLAGNLSVGSLISFFGYALFLVVPIQTLFEFAQKWVRAMVSATKAVAVFEQQPPWTDREDPLPLPTGAPLVEERSGFLAEPGRLTVVVSGQPDESAALADRLGRYLTVERDPVSLEIDEKAKGRQAKRLRQQRLAELRELAARDREAAGGTWGVRLGSVDLGDAALADVRATILVSDTGSRVFAGTLQDLIDPHHRLSREQAEEALRIASAEDVWDALPEGWQSRIDEGGRGLSGGQRQRLVLARALAADPEVLVLVEPTSAVDAHTEARIAERLAEHRRGRTTVIVTVSPLVLHHADRVLFYEDGRVTARGRHAELLATHPAYRRVAGRSLDDEALPGPADALDDPPAEPALVTGEPGTDGHHHARSAARDEERKSDD